MSNQETYKSHYCCWEQKLKEGTPACGMPLEKHKQCCLCEAHQETQESWEKEFEKWIPYVPSYLTIPDSEIMDKELKEFIKNLILSERQRIIDIMENMKNPYRLININKANEYEQVKRIVLSDLITSIKES